MDGLHVRPCLHCQKRHGLPNIHPPATNLNFSNSESLGELNLRPLGVRCTGAAPTVGGRAPLSRAPGGLQGSQGYVSEKEVVTESHGKVREI